MSNKTTRFVGLIAEDGEHQYNKLELLPPDADGDGTVPVCGAIFKAPGLKSQAGFSVDHEGAYKSEESRWFTLRAILKIAQDIKNTGLVYED